MPAPSETRVFALGPDTEFGERLCEQLGTTPAPWEDRRFEDGEHKWRPMVSVRGRDVFVTAALVGDGASVNDRLVRLLFFVNTLKDAAAASVTVVAPYLSYARKDQRTQPRDPVTTRYVAALFEAVGTDCLMTLDVHNPAAFENAFRRPTVHLEGTRLFADHLAATPEAADLAVVAPDYGAAKRAERLRQSLERRLDREIPLAVVEKYRAKGEVTGGRLIGDVTGRTAVVVDDLVSTGGTLARAARSCLQHGAREVRAMATHALFAEGAERHLEDPALSALAVTNTVPARGGPSAALAAKLTVIDAAPLFAEAIRRMQSGGGVSGLLERQPGHAR